MKAEAGFRLLGKYFNYCIGDGDEKLGRLIQIKIDLLKSMRFQI